MVKTPHILATSLIVVAVAVSTSAAAQDYQDNKKQGFYAGFGLGFSHLRESELEGLNADINFKSGWAQNVRLGYKWDNFRTEVEYANYEGGIKTLTSPIVGANVNASGDMDIQTAMMNVYYDINLDSAARPYLGFGYGKRRIHLDSVATTGGTFVDGKSARWGYQLLGGMAYDVTPTVALNIEYRFTQANGKGTRFATAEGVDYLEARQHSVFAGLNYYFGKKKQKRQEPVFTPPAKPEPAPVVKQEPPAPAPKPEPVMKPVPYPITIYFDFDSAALGDAAEELIELAARRYTDHGSVDIRLDGHTDRKGGRVYNAKLSEERADAVKAALMNAGVPQADIYTSVFGESRPAKATADGVREPLNRRVELRFERH